MSLGKRSGAHQVRKRLVVVFAAVAALSLASCGGSDDDKPAPVPSPTVNATSCGALVGKSIGGATISVAAIVPAAPASGATLAQAEHCKVTARILPKLNFEVRLPTSWNGKLHYSGGGGFNGSIPTVDLSALGQGYVDVSSDSGHTGSAIDASFALNDPVALRLFSQLSVPTVATAAKQITKAAYGVDATKSYFEGCSNGGREGLMTALRFPTLFDGVIAKAPARKFIAAGENYQRTARLLKNVSGSTVNSAKLATLSSAVLGACDALDGVADGIIANISACNFNIDTLRCPGGADTGDTCLSDAQLNVFKTETSRLTGGTGTPYVTSYSPYFLWGEESTPGSWGSWILSDPSITGLFTDSMVKYLLAGDPTADWVSFDYKANAPIVQAMAAEIDVTDTNLSPFMLTGAKLLVWQGAADIAVSPQGTIDYYNDVVASVGGQATADSFMRFYIAPGVMHCGGGAGADQTTQLLPALDAWATQSTAPGDLTATKLDATGATVLSRPMCRHPTFAKYKGTGNVNDAASYTCATP